MERHATTENAVVTHPLLAATGPLAARTADVGVAREARRRRRLWTLAAVLAGPTAYLWYRVLDGRPFDVFALPSVDWIIAAPLLFFALLILLLVGTHVGAGRSPHVTYRPEQIDVRLADVVGIDPVKEEVVRSLNLFLAHATFAREMGGRPRRGLLFEGAPGTGKTHLAKAMAAEAGVPFLFVSATAFQSMFYGATARKIRSYFRALRKTARQEGGAIGFIEEIDAIALRRGGLSMSPAPKPRAYGCGGLVGLPALSAALARVTHPSVVSEGTGGVVNELLVQLQSFDEPTGLAKAAGRIVDGVNLYLPATRQLPKRKTGHATAAYLVAPHRRLEILTIVKRRGALGLLAHGDPEDVYTRSRAEMRALVQIALAGQCAEELFIGDVSTGPGGDLLYATNLAAEMVGAVGMDGTLVSYAAVHNSGLADTNIVGRVLADPEGRARVEAVLQDQKQAVRALLADHRPLVAALRDALLEREELIGREITEVLDAARAVAR